jgi:hypothetical protein
MKVAPAAVGGQGEISVLGANLKDDFLLCVAESTAFLAGAINPSTASQQNRKRDRGGRI